MKLLNGLEAVLVSPIGKVGIKTNGSSLVGIEFISDEIETAEPSSQLGREVAAQLHAYFQNKLHTFNVPIFLSVSSFQQTVLENLCSIPFGKTATYGELAKKIETSPRAIGNACRRNPLPIIIPCHRVVAQNHIGGYSGALSGNLLTMKKWLLQHEAIS